jgi:hypothetical protein
LVLVVLVVRERIQALLNVAQTAVLRNLFFTQLVVVVVVRLAMSNLEAQVVQAVAVLLTPQGLSELGP